MAESVTLTLSAFSKINLDLRVLGTRPDGYHDLKTVFQSLALHDDLTLTWRKGPFVIECDDGSLVLAGQAHDTASQWSSDVLAARAPQLGHEAPLPLPSSWMARILEFDPRRVVFAHDAAVWMP